MVFSDSAGKAGIVQDIDFWVNTDDNSYPIAQKTRNINRWLDDVVSIILACDGRWEWDDSNNTDLPIGTAALVNNQQDYSISGATFLDVTRVEVKDINGNYYLLNPISQHDVTTQALSEFQKTAGRPIYYDKVGDSIFLYPKPSSSAVTLSAGLKVYFQRVGSYFTVNDTTKSPGFAPLFHRILSVGPALDYAMANDMSKKITTLNNVLEGSDEKPGLLKRLVTHYSSRSKDEQVRMRTRKEAYGAEDMDSMGGSSNNGMRDTVAF